MNHIARIGIDARKLKDYGIGSYIQNLLESLGKLPESSAYRFRVYARQSDADAVPELPGHFEVVHDDSPGYSLAELTRLPWRLLRDRLDLFRRSLRRAPGSRTRGASRAQIRRCGLQRLGRPRRCRRRARSRAR